MSRLLAPASVLLPRRTERLVCLYHALARQCTERNASNELSPKPFAGIASSASGRQLSARTAASGASVKQSTVHDLVDIGRGASARTSSLRALGYEAEIVSKARRMPPASRGAPGRAFVATCPAPSPAPSASTRRAVSGRARASPTSHRRSELSPVRRAGARRA